MSSDELARFLRSRRAARSPETAGVPDRPRGLRREDVARLASMSADYYRRLEQARVGPPSAQILEALARALGLTDDERDYLFRLADRERPPRPMSGRVEPALRQLLDGLGDTPAMIMSLLGDVLVQNRTAVSLFGDYSGAVGDARNSTYRWFTDPSARLMHPAPEHEEESHARVAELRSRWLELGDPAADRLIGRLRSVSAEFERVWQDQRVAICRSGTKTLIHPAIGAFDLDAQILRAEGLDQLLVAMTAPPGSRAVERLSELTAVSV